MNGQQLELIPLDFIMKLSKLTAFLFILLVILQILQLVFKKVYNNIFRSIIQIIAIVFATTSIITELLKIFDEVTFRYEIYQRIFYILISIAIAGYTFYIQYKQ